MIGIREKIKNMKIVALLPMKGNSERVPNKNLKLFNGKPLFHIVVQTLLESKYIEAIVVNTDSNEIKENIEKNFGNKVTVINRPSDMIGDMVSMNRIIGHDINVVNADLYIQTHSTNPLLRTSSIDKALGKMLSFDKKNDFDSIFSVTRHQTRLYDSLVKPINHNPKELIRTQDLEPLYEENSNFYIFSKNSFLAADNKRIGVKPFIFELNKIEAIDIDEPEDFIIAEALHKLLR